MHISLRPACSVCSIFRPAVSWSSAGKTDPIFDLQRCNYESTKSKNQEAGRDSFGQSDTLEIVGIRTWLVRRTLTLVDAIQKQLQLQYVRTHHDTRPDILSSGMRWRILEMDKKVRDRWCSTKYLLHTKTKLRIIFNRTEIDLQNGNNYSLNFESQIRILFASAISNMRPPEICVRLSISRFNEFANRIICFETNLVK